MKKQPATELQLSRDEFQIHLTVTANAGGEVDITVREEPRHPSGYSLSLGQAIHLRDFLNRHIDGLALAATGSLAVRSSDDPSQLASEEFIAAVQEGIADAEAGNLVSLNDVKAKWLGRRHPDLVPGKVVDAPAGDLHLVWNPEKTECVGFFNATDAEYTATGVTPDTSVTAVGLDFRKAHIDWGSPEGAELSLPRTKITFY